MASIVSYMFQYRQADIFNLQSWELHYDISLLLIVYSLSAIARPACIARLGYSHYSKNPLEDWLLMSDDPFLLARKR